jgi:hypothetical protein
MVIGISISAGSFSPAYGETCGGLSSGHWYNCFLTSAGNVDCYNTELSDLYGETAGYTGGDAVGVAAGEDHTCVFTSGGNVTCFGLNNKGQAEPYNGGDAVGVGVGSRHTCVLTAGGNVDCYGFNDYGQAEDYTGGDAVGLAVGYWHTCVLTLGGNVDCYGDELWQTGQAEDYTGGDAVGVFAGFYHTCVITEGGNVDCYGQNNLGQAPDGIDYAGGDAIGGAAGLWHTCVLTSGGNVVCHGDNIFFQSEPYNGGDAVGVSAGYWHTCVLTSGGNLDCFGDDYYGQNADYLGGDAVCSLPNCSETASCSSISLVDILDLVTWYYQSILDRDPEPDGAEAWTAEIQRILSLGIDVKEGFIALGKLFFNSGEYLSKSVSDEAYIIELYETFLGRTPSGIGEEAGEVDDWMAELEGGLTRNLLLNYFIFSEEFRIYMEEIFGDTTVWPEYSLVNDLYRGFLSRLPEDSGFNDWLALMQDAQCTGEQAVQDLTNEIGILFIQGAEYAARNPELDNPDFSSEFVTNLYDAVLRRGAELAGYLAWKEQYDSDTLSFLLILMSFRPGSRKS